MDKDLKENLKTELTKELSPLADALSRSEFQDIVLYGDDSETFEGTCDGQIYDFEVKELCDALTETGILEEDVQIPLMISANVKKSFDPVYPVILETKCILGEFCELSLYIPYSKDFKRASISLLLVKFGDAKGRSEQLDLPLERLFKVEEKILMRRLTSDGKIRPRVRYRIA